MARFAEQGFPLSPGGKLPGLLSQTFGFLGKALFEGLSLLEPAALHDTTSSYGS